MKFVKVLSWLLLAGLLLYLIVIATPKSTDKASPVHQEQFSPGSALADEFPESDFFNEWSGWVYRSESLDRNMEEATTALRLYIEGNREIRITREDAQDFLAAIVEYVESANVLASEIINFDYQHFK